MFLMSWPKFRNSNTKLTIAKAVKFTTKVVYLSLTPNTIKSPTLPSIRGVVGPGNGFHGLGTERHTQEEVYTFCFFV